MNWLHSAHYGMSEQKTYRKNDCCIPIRRGPAIVCASSHQLVVEHLMFFLVLLLCNQSTEKIIKPPKLLFSWLCGHRIKQIQSRGNAKRYRSENSPKPHTKEPQSEVYVIPGMEPTGCSTSSSNFSVNATTNISWATLHREHTIVRKQVTACSWVLKWCVHIQLKARWESALKHRKTKHLLHFRW